MVVADTNDGDLDTAVFLQAESLEVPLPPVCPAINLSVVQGSSLQVVLVAGARMMGLEERVGTLERGKDADFIVLSGDPLSVYTHVEQTWVEGNKVFDLADPRDREFAIGRPDNSAAVVDY